MPLIKKLTSTNMLQAQSLKSAALLELLIWQGVHRLL